MPPNLLFRTDASAEIGQGHVMRCMALAQLARDQGSGVRFLTSSSTALSLVNQIESDGIEVSRLSHAPGTPRDTNETIECAHQHGCRWVVLDGYTFDFPYQDAVKQAGLRLLFIDDHGYASRYTADVVLNQNLHATESLYAHRDSHTRLLLGSQFVMLRREFMKYVDWQRQVQPVARKIVIMFGGADPENTSSLAIEALQQLNIPGMEVRVALGAQNRNFRRPRDFPKGAPAITIDRDVKNIPEWLVWADLAVSGAGTTAWELAFMGLPSLLVTVAENQRATAEQLERRSIAVQLGSANDVTADGIAARISALISDHRTRAEMAERGRRLIDGRGAARVLAALNQPSLRRATEEDCQAVWKVANEPSTRAASFAPDPIAWGEHVAWFQCRVRDPNCVFYVVLDDSDSPCGQVRFDLHDEEAVISIALQQQHRGRGFGSRAIILACQKLLAESDVRVINAYVKEGNAASIRAFSKAAFRESGETPIKGQLARHFILERDKFEHSH